jgi:integrase
MAYAEKRDGKLTGQWVGEVNTKLGRMRRRFETHREALGYEAYVKATGFEPAHLSASKASGPTFADVAAHARASNETWKRNRDPSGQRCLDWLIGRIGDLPISDVDTTRLDRLVKELSAKPGVTSGSKLSAGTINRYLSAASGVLKFARARGMVASQPVVPWLKETGHRIAFLDEALQPIVVGYMVSQGWLAAALALRVLVASGMRWGEFISVDAIQLTSEWIKLDATKTDTPRDIPLDPKLMGEFKAMVIQNGRPNYTTMRRQLKAALEACGGDPAIGIHNLRHTTATRLNKLEVPTATVQQFLGHKDIKTTMKYLHVEAADLMAASKKLTPRVGGEEHMFHNADVVPFTKSTG